MTTSEAAVADFGSLADGTRYYAPLGRMLVSGDRVCCHLCGRWFLSVASHLRVHGWTKADYLDAFGLERSNALRGEATRKRRAAVMAGRQVVEPAIRTAQQAARERARSGALAHAAAEAARGRSHPIERRRKTYAALGQIDPHRQRAANVRRGQAQVRAEAEAIGARFGFAGFADYAHDRIDAGLSLSAISREAGRHKDWLARHAGLLIGTVDPDVHRAGVLDARWPVDRAELGMFLYERHVRQHRTVAAIAAEVGLSRASVVAALRRHGIAVEAHAGSRHAALSRDDEVAAALGYACLTDYIAERRNHGLAWTDLAAETGIPATSLRRRMARAS